MRKTQRSSRQFTFLYLSMFLAPLLSPGVYAQDESLSPEINKPYKDPNAEKTAANYERENRDVVKAADKIIAACELESGLEVADIGAGTGLFTRPFAAKVAPGGKIYAVDITQPFLDYVAKTCKEQGIDNVKCVLCTAGSAKLPAASIDVAFICDTYHHMEYPYKMLDSIYTAVRPGGRLIIVDYKKEKGVGPEWIFGHVRANKKTVIDEVTKAGFTFVDEVEVMKLQYLIRFVKK